MPVLGLDGRDFKTSLIYEADGAILGHLLFVYCILRCMFLGRNHNIAQAYLWNHKS